MQLDTITMDRNDARRAFIEYRTAVRARHDHEDEAIMRAYRAASRGAALIRLGEVLGSGGITTCDVPVTRWDGKRKMSVEVGARPVELPALAVARADVLAVWTSGINSEGGCELRYTPNQITERSRERHVMANGTFPAATRRRPDQHWRPRIRAMAPNIPAPAPARVPPPQLPPPVGSAMGARPLGAARRSCAAQAPRRRPLRRPRRLGSHTDRASCTRRNSRMTTAITLATGAATPGLEAVAIPYGGLPGPSNPRSASTL